ncbi:PP2C family protein-serine/threonine phosphatase [Paracoccus sp. Ld10]|uniref:PP2C family protein-serine/threonine phosphatase n=1 Tax=Paracoccus sp. Ld10 TaxID=649158 RepID=UPI00386625EE
MTATEVLFQFRTGALSDTGLVRSHNEDALTAIPDLGLWAIADGMGGHAAGDVASGMIVEELASLGVPVSAQDQRARVLERIERAHHRILAHADAHQLKTVGATLAVLLIHGGELTCIWAGDSRIYLWRDHALTPLTQDHSEVAQMVAAGTLSAAEARQSPRRNVITRAIGIGAVPQPDMVGGALRDGDRLLLCSDGLTEHVTDSELGAMLALPEGAEPMAQALIALTLERGARDNVSVIVVDCTALPATDEAT